LEGGVLSPPKPRTALTAHRPPPLSTTEFSDSLYRESIDFDGATRIRRQNGHLRERACLKMSPNRNDSLLSRFAGREGYD
jgi:hypothetical protein